MEQTRDRLIRFTELNDPAKPGLLSRYDAERNIIEIDRVRHDCLPRFYQTRLMFTELPFTKLTEDSNEFVGYDNESRKAEAAAPVKDYSFLRGF